jgi:hypothetical protein
MAPCQPDRPYPQKVVWRHNDLHCDTTFLMAPDTPQRLSGHTIRAAHHNQLPPQYLLLQIIIAQRESSNIYIQMCYKHDVSLCTYRKEHANPSIKTATHIRVGMGTKRTPPLQCSPATSRSQGGGNGHRTAKHNQLYSKTLNRLTVAGNSEQQALTTRKHMPSLDAKQGEDKQGAEKKGKCLRVKERT